MRKKSIHEKIIAAAAKSAGITQAKAKAFLDGYHANIMVCLQAGEAVRVRGFGSFYIKTMKPIVRSGGCLGPINVPERQKVRFRAAFDM